jgi:hypothetical protein
MLFVDFVAFCSRLIGTGQEQPRESIDLLDLMEVEQEPKRYIEEFHLIEKLRLVNWEQKVTKATKHTRQAATIAEQRDGDHSPGLQKPSYARCPGRTFPGTGTPAAPGLGPD